MRIELEEGEIVIEKYRRQEVSEGETLYLIKTGTYAYLVGSFAELVETLRGLFGIKEEEE